MPRHLTHIVLGFETDDGGARSPLDSAGYEAKKDPSQVNIDKVRDFEGVRG